MYRLALEQLKAWKDKPTKKPLIILGARQVGKTWLMKKFGNDNYANTIYLNFESNARLSTLFDQDLDPNQLLQGIEIEIGQKIDITSSLLILDEIQENSKALTSLKYFNERMPQLDILSAGSLLGVTLHEGTSFPVGKVEFMNLYPMNFKEFLIAVGEDGLVDLINDKNTTMINVFAQKFIDQLRLYYFIGGMPEVVQNYTKIKDLKAVREIQHQLLNSYEQDFSKHAPGQIVSRIRMLWKSLPAQLSKENKKFIYGQIKSGARAKDYELAMTWLLDMGLINKITRTKKPHIPLSAYEDTSAFKLYLLDLGLLGALCEIDSKSILEGNRLFTEFKGALTEQYVIQQLKTLGIKNPNYWTADKGTAELDFLLSHNGKIYPIEVKAEENLKAKSLKVFKDKYDIEPCYRISMSNYREENWLTNVPLYGLELLGLDK